MGYRYIVQRWIESLECWSTIVNVPDYEVAGNVYMMSIEKGYKARIIKG